MTTPAQARLRFVTFELVDSTGAAAFPGERPVNFRIIVDPTVARASVPPGSSGSTGSSTGTPATPR